jgi:hypothetical protein
MTLEVVAILTSKQHPLKALTLMLQLSAAIDVNDDLNVS